MNLSQSTQVVLRDDETEHRDKISTHNDIVPSRWERIGLAAQRKGIVFNNLLCHINAETLREAFDALDGSKALGIDGVSKKIYGRNLEANLRNLVSRIHIGSYKPQTKREVLIPKANGRTRPIAISCFEDKLVEWVLGKILEQVYEPIFIRNSYGFRPYKSADGAIQATFYSLKDDRRPYVVEIDFANFFNSIPHRKLMKTLGKRISDRRFKGLIGRFLMVGVLEQSGIITESESGTPQGSVMSPVLANVYLHEVVDSWFLENHASYNNIIVRYADDAVFFFNQEETANTFVGDLEKRIQSYGLSLNKDKTRVIDFEKNQESTFDFLGFTFYWGEKKRFRKRPLKIKTQKKTLHRKIQEFYLWIKSVRSKLRTREIWNQTKAKLRGHYNYYGYWMNRPKLMHFFREVLRSLFKWLNRRSQKVSFVWESFQRKLELDPLPSPPSISQLKQLGVNLYV